MTDAEKEHVIRILRDTMEKGLTQVLVNPQTPNTVLPLRFHSQSSLLLNLSWRFDGADNDFGPDAFQTSLTFDGARFRCSLPWDCFLAIVPFVKPDTPQERRSRFKVVS